MNKQLEGISNHMLDLGLSALAHANRHAAYADFDNGKWSELSVLQAAHAAEILIKARIAEEHPLLIFDTFPKLPKNGNLPITVEDLFKRGKTIQWSELLTRLWAATGIEIIEKELFEEFGQIRNGIQHFSSLPNTINATDLTLNFVFKVIDPFINECWGLYAIDYDEDYDSYEHFPNTLIRREIPFLISPDAIEHYELWIDTLKETSEQYQSYLEGYIKENYSEQDL